MAEASEEVARINQETAEQQLAWAREQDSLNRETLNRVLDVQLPAMEQQAQFAQEDRQRYQQLFQPLEESLIKDAEDYASPERISKARAGAIADVSGMFDAQRRNALQRLEGYGVDPSETRNAALDIGVRTQQAAAQVAAANQAAEGVERRGHALRSEAINVGRGYPGQVAQAYGGATNTGSAAVQGGATTTGAGANAASSAGQFSGLALQGYGQSANIMNQGYQNQFQGWNAQQQQRAGMLQGVGQIAGAAMMMRDGGKAQGIPFQQDGPVQTGMGDGSGIDDAVPARLSDGEYVIPADVVRAKGTEFFDKLVERYHTPAEMQESMQHA